MLAVGGVQVLILLLGLLRAKFLSVTLGPAGYGLVGTIDQLVLALISLGTLGLPFAGLKFMARGHSEGQHNFERTYAGFLWALAVLGILTAAIGAGLGLFAPEIFGKELAGYGWLIAVAMLGIPASMVNMLVANALAASQRGRESALFTLAIQGLLLAATIAGVYAAGTKGIYVATVVVGSVTTVAAIVALRRSLGSPLAAGPAWFKAEVKRDRTVMTYSAWVYIATAIYTVSLSGVRTSVFSQLGAANAGLLQASLGLALTVGAVINPISNLILAPFLNRSIPVDQKVTAANDFAMKVLTLLLVGGLPLVMFPRFAMSLLFAHEFLPAAAILFAFIIWQCIAQLVNVYTQLLVGIDDVAVACAILAVGYGAVFLMTPSMTSLFGLPGVAVALIAGVIVVGIANGIRLQRKYHASIRRTVAVRLIFTVAAILLAATLTVGSPEFSTRGFTLRLAIALALLALQWFLLDSSEREWTRSRLRLLRLSRNRPN